MKPATLIVNPASGRARLLTAQLPAIEAILIAHGYRTEIRSTTPEPESARDHARESAKTASLILACGGDGTIHGVLQGLVGTQVPMGVIPLGTANALARNLRLPLDPLAAVRKLMGYVPASISVGVIEIAGRTHFFAVMAGCGPDGALAHTLGAATKSKLGRSAYYLHAARLFATRRWPAFQVDYRAPGSTQWHTTQAVSLIASRVPDLGGPFSGITRTADPRHLHLHAYLLRAPAHLSFPAWLAATHLRLPNPWLTTIDAEEIRCTPLSPEPIYAQADAESLGSLPITLRIVSDGLCLLMPPSPPVAKIS